MKKLLFAACIILAASGAAALADYPVRDSAGFTQTIKAFLLNTGAQITQMLPSDTTGTPYSPTNPFPVTMGATPTGAATAANQTTGNTSLATVATNTGTSATGIGAPADSAYAGSGSSSIIAALKGLYNALTGTLTVSNRNSLSLTQTVVSLTANTDTTLAATNATRRYLSICNIGTTRASLAFDQAAVVSSGLPIAAAATVGDQGGCQTWESGAIPTNAIHGISSGAISVVVIQG